MPAKPENGSIFKPEIPLPPHVSILTKPEFTQKDLPRFRELVYALYTPNNYPITIPSPPTHQELNSHYLLLHAHDTFSKGNPPKNLWPQIDILKEFNQIAGFFNIETVTQSNQASEVTHLFEWDWQTHPYFSYLSEFSPHPSNTKDQKLEILSILFQAFKQIQPLPETLIVLADHVKEFVIQTGLVNLTKTDAVIASNEHVRKLQQMFPKYWNTNPKLYTLSFI